ncbi:cupin domain-containing protein [Streptomyces sp. NPDC059255]|uniref:cupin domain-containing protein n=1 Tax=Streptomyces sp. NPDC059255 TaxID=3346793 RepID=UPI0036B15833
MNLNPRRVVVGTDGQGQAVILSDGPNPHTRNFTSTPGLAVARIWGTRDGLTTAVPDGESTVAAGPFLPPPGGSTFALIQYAPDSVALSPGFDPAAAGAEFAADSPDMAASMEPDAPGMHRTDTVDLVVVISGSIWIEVDGGVETELHAGDTVVQLGGRHAWRNRSAEPATLAFVLLGAERV